MCVCACVCTHAHFPLFLDHTVYVFCIYCHTVYIMYIIQAGNGEATGGGIEGHWLCQNDPQEPSCSGCQQVTALPTPSAAPLSPMH